MSDQPPSEREIHVRDSQGFAVGDHNTVINYFSRVTAGEKVTRPHSITISGPLESPYLGLKTFSETDAPLFFGREQATGDIMRRLAGVLRSPAPLIVSGVSGAGKSSLLRAGILPWMGEAGLASEPGIPPWPHLTLTATGAPLAELATGVAALAGSDAASLRTSLAADPSSLALAVRQAVLRAAPGKPGRLLLIVDQFEQVFTQCPDEAERRAFIAALHAAATTGHGPEQAPAAVVVLVIRADFEAQCAEYEELADAVQDRYLLRPMTQRQLRLAITQPAEMLGSSVEPDLVGELVRAAAPADGPVGAGILPHLSHSLDQAWRNRAGEVLTLADYERTGGVEGSIAASAEHAYAGLTAAQRTTARSVFMRLVTTSSDLVVSAGRASVPDLVAGGSAADVTAVVEAFAAQRLLTVGEDSVEISHEVLLTAWERFRDWLDGDRIDMARYSRLAADAREWDAAGRTAGYLYRPGRLEEVNAAGRRWTAAPNRYPPLSAASASFLQAARRAARRSRRARRGVIAVLSALTLAAAAAAAVAGYQHSQTVAQQEISLSRQLAAQSLTVPGLAQAQQLAVAAWRVSPTSQASSAMSTLLARQDQAGELPAVTSDSGKIVEALAFSPGGTLLAAGDGNSVRLWDPDTGKPVGRPLAIRGDSTGVTSVAFSPDGRLLAAAASGQVTLWNPATGRNAGTITGSVATSLAFSPAGALLAVASDSGLELWSVTPRIRLIRSIRGYFGTTTFEAGVAFNQGGTLVAAVGTDAKGDDTVGVWRTATGAPVSTLSASVLGSPSVYGIAFDPTGDLLATAGSNGQVREWNATTGAPASRPLPAGSDVNGASGVAFSPDGTLLASAGGDGYVRLWNPATGTPAGHPMADDPSTGWVASVAFSPQRGLLASGDSDGVVHLWNTATDAPVGATLRQPVGSTGGVASFSDQVSYLGPGSDGYVGQWSAATLAGKAKPPPGDPGDRAAFFGNPPVTFSTSGSMYAQQATGGITYGGIDPLTSRFLPAAPGRNNQVTGIQFSPGGRLLATSAGDYLTLWNVATGRRARTLLAASGRNAAPGAWTFSPDGRYLATSSCPLNVDPAISLACSVTLWNVTTGTRARAPFPVTTSGGGSGLTSLNFSPDGKLLAAPDNGAIRLWNAATGEPAGTLPAVNPADAGDVEVAGFSPDGRLLAAMYASGAIQLWNPATKTPVGGILGATAEGATNPIPSLAYSTDSGLLVSMDEIGGETADVTPYPLWQFADPYATLCDESGPPPLSVWQEYSGGVPEPDGICAGVPPASRLSG